MKFKCPIHVFLLVFVDKENKSILLNSKHNDTKIPLGSFISKFFKLHVLAPKCLNLPLIKLSTQRFFIIFGVIFSKWAAMDFQKFLPRLLSTTFIFRHQLSPELRKTHEVL